MTGSLTGIFGGVLASKEKQVLTGVEGYKNTTVGVTSDTLTLTGIPSTTDIVVVFINEFPNSTSVTSVTGCGATWSQQTTFPGTSFAVSTWAGVGCDGINNTVTWHSGSAMQNEMSALVVSNLVTVTGTLIGHNAGSPATTASTGSVTPSKAAGICLGAIAYNVSSDKGAHADNPVPWTVHAGVSSADWEVGTLLIVSAVPSSMVTNPPVALAYAGNNLYLPTP